jgi:transposase
VERSTTDPAGDAARRGGHQALARGALAAYQKKAADEAYTVVWVDESGFYLLPLAVCTWAPKGETPVLRVKFTHDHLSAISGITLDGRLFMQVREDSFDSEGVVGFLRVLLRKIRGKALVIWDGSPIHKGQPIKDYLAQGAAQRLPLERLPSYAPDLNPDEGIWTYWKRVELKNRCCADLAGAAPRIAPSQGALAAQTCGHPSLCSARRLSG